MKSVFPTILLAFLVIDRCDAEDVHPELLFVRRVLPMLQQKCLPCHGADATNISGGLDLRSSESSMSGGDSGTPLISVERPENSPLLLTVKRQHDDWPPMPPREADQLSVEQIEWLCTWIQGGAPWPRADRIAEIESRHADEWSREDGIIVKTSGGTSPDWTNRRYRLEDLWAYQPLQKPQVPESRHSARADHNPVDAFIAARIPAGLQAAPRADRRTLIRRATFDLTGLPPSPEDVATFENDLSSDAEAFAKVVDRLLQSPHYGERMAQHWLDVVRYADSSGFANDYERGNAWRYRDYVVRSFNLDKPYDQFVREQIAGDELAPRDPEMQIAVGFLRMGPWELTGMEVAKVARQRFLDDVVNSVGETFLAHSLQCARCHDHKFDPIPTRDYYSVQAVFATTQLAEVPTPFLATENLQNFDELRFLEQRRDEYIRVLDDLDQLLLGNAEQWFEANEKDPSLWKDTVDRVRRAGIGDGKRNSQDLFGTARRQLLKQGVPEESFPPRLVGFTAEQFGMERVARKGLERLRWEMERYEPFALSVYNGLTPKLSSINAPVRVPADRLNAGVLESTCILPGGDPFAKGDLVHPDVLSILNELEVTQPPNTIDGRRRAFAEWVANSQNPLTARTIVNRIWMWHFNQPIAGNPNNFGTTGKKPTHPELLNWLAATLIEESWSLKSIHRIILNSETYCRSSEHPNPALLHERDPVLSSFTVFQPRRLSGEELRDAMLSATGELNATSGGVPNRPEINPEAALQPRQVMGTFASAWIPNPLPEQRHRRSLYSLKLRGLTDPFLEVFNSPVPDFSCERREVSTVTPQVFSLFNGQPSHSRALALAARTAGETSSDEEAIQRCYALLFSRSASAEELRLCLDHWREVERLFAGTPTISEPPPLEIVRHAVEENTGENFSYRETLHSNLEFVPDLQPVDVTRRVRALADVCLVLFNSNEFVYVY